MAAKIMNFKEFQAHNRATNESQEGMHVDGALTAQEYMQEIAPHLLTAKLHAPMTYSQHMRWMKDGKPALSKTDWEIETDTDLDDNQPDNMSVFVVVACAPATADKRLQDLASAFHLVMHAEIDVDMTREGDSGDHETPPEGDEFDTSFKFKLVDVCDESGESVLSGDAAQKMLNWVGFEARLQRDGESIFASKLEGMYQHAHERFFDKDDYED